MRSLGRWVALAFPISWLAALLHAESGVMPAPPPGVVETGAPAFVVLGPEAMGLRAAPSDLHLLPDGRILAVSQREIAFSDGVRWEVFHAAQNESPIVSQVAVDADGRVYAGIEGGITRIDMDANARWFRTRVADLPAPHFANVAPVSFVNTAGRWLWYGGGGGLVTWQPGQMPRGTFQVPPFDRGFSFDDRIFLRNVALGHLSELGPDLVARLVPSTVLNAAECVTVGIPFGPGKALVGTASNGLHIFDGETLTPFPTNGWAVGHRVVDLCAVDERYLAAALDGVGLVFFDRDGQAVQVLDRSLDHRLARVRRIFARGDGVIWALLNDGVTRVELPSPLSNFEPLLATGLAYAKPVRHEGKLWVQGDGNIMRAVYTPNGRLTGFEKDNPPGNFAYTIAVLDGELFVSNETGIFVREAGAWVMAAPGIPNGRLIPAKGNPRGWPYLARGEYGFLRRTPAGFAVERFPAPELPENYNAVTDDEGVAWIELGLGRAARFDPRGEKPTLRLFGPEDGLTSGWVEIYILEGVARIHLPGHVWRYDATTAKLVADRELIQRFPILPISDGRPVLDGLGRLWHTTSGVARLIERDGTGNYAERKIPVSFGPYEYTVQEDGVLWFFSDRRFSRLDLRVAPPPPPSPKPLITSVQYSASNRRIFQPGAVLEPLAYRDNSLVIHFAAPANPFGAPVTFEILLEGSGTQWVSTGTVGSATFNRLKEGNYAFRVRPVIGGAPAGTEAKLAFTVGPPWFRTRLAWFAYTVAAAGTLAFSAWLSSFLQRRENERLERLVNARTGELATANVQLSQQISETTEKSLALTASEERYRTLNVELEERVRNRTAELSVSNAELQQRESLFRLIFEHAPVGIFWKRADLGDAYHLNARLRSIFGLPGDTLADFAPLASLVHPEDLDRQTKLNQLIQSGEQDSYNVEERFVLENGQTVWGSLSVAVVRDDRGRIVQDIGILEDITARKDAEEKLAKTYKNLVDASRTAGMAEVATGVLHNVGNVLNSLNVASNSIAMGLHRSRVGNVVKLAQLVNDHAGQLGEFLTHDPKGKLVPDYLAKLAQHVVDERDWLLEEVNSMQKNIDHIKDIVAMQQGYATAAGVVERLEAPILFEDALRMNTVSLTRHEVTVVREFLPVPAISVEKGKMLQILVNLIRNAQHACDDAQATNHAEKIIVVRIEPAGPDRVRFIVRDNGVGICPENLTRIFAHGFTTRAYGKGFGLHSSVLAAKEMKGSLVAFSEGVGRGATFTLELPVDPDPTAHSFPLAGSPEGKPANATPFAK